MIETIIKIMEKYGYVYAQGLAGTLCLAGITIVAGTAVGTALALMRMAKLRPPGTVCEGLCVGAAGHAHFAAAVLFLDPSSQGPPL